MPFWKDLGIGRVNLKYTPPVPTAYTPWHRRFGSEDKRERKETLDLYNRVVDLFNASPFSTDDGMRDILLAVKAHLPDIPSIILRDAVYRCAVDIVFLEKFMEAGPEWSETLTMKEWVELRRFLRAQEHFLTHQERITTQLVDAVQGILNGLIGPLPVTEDAKDPLFQVPITHFYSDTALAITGIINAFHHEDEPELFETLRRQFYLNVCAVSKQVPDTEHKRPLLYPTDTDLPPDEALERYLDGTPFLPFLRTSLPLEIEDETFFSHTHIVGGSGSGKTQFLSSLILHHISNPNRPSIVVVDSQGDLIEKLSHLEEIQGRLVLITPKDIDYPPAINIFDLKHARIGTYDRLAQEQVIAGAIQTLDYLFTGIVGADLTAKQGVFFRYVARLLITLPHSMGRNATILDMINLMDDITPYLPAIEKLSPIQRQFFEKDFRQSVFKATKEQVRYRLNAILENPTLERLFTSPETKLDLFTELNSGKIILVDTAKDFLKGSSAHFGRIFIALILQAILERSAISESKRHPTHLIVDEAHEYFDQNIDDMLTQVRKYKAGAVFAHQYLGQAREGLRASFASNTAIKMVSGVSTQDARALAPDLRTSPEYILGQPRLHFATFIRGVTTHAVSTPVQAGRLEKRPRMSFEAFQEFIESNRANVTLPSQPDPEEEPEPVEGAPPPRPAPIPTNDPWNVDV